MHVTSNTLKMSLAEANTFASRPTNSWTSLSKLQSAAEDDKGGSIFVLPRGILQENYH
ncbi:hypothetical protein NC652_001093 [Populus alba x Populus x berolinensis]|nr:hypothetical protein NC652_001093 [Populus alba x Populus x berolinensis]